MPTSQGQYTSGSVIARGTLKHTYLLSHRMPTFRVEEGVLSVFRVSRWGHGRDPHVSLDQRRRELSGAPVHVGYGAEHSSYSSEEGHEVRGK